MAHRIAPSWLSKLIRSGRGRRHTSLARACRIRKLIPELLEDRVVLSTYMVTSSSRSASVTGSLGYEIGMAVAANDTAATILFNNLDVPDNSTIQLGAGDVNSAAAKYGPTAYFINGTSGTSITIDGSGAPGLVIDGGGAVRLFTVASGNSLTLENLTLQHGYAFGGEGYDGGGGGGGLGGAVFDDGGSFTAEGCTFVNNQALGGQGGGGPGTLTSRPGIGGGGGGMGASAPTNGNGGGVHGGQLELSGGFGGGGGGATITGGGHRGGFGGGGGGGGSLSPGSEEGGLGGFGGGGGGGGVGYPSLFGGGKGGSWLYIGGGGGGAGLGGGIFNNQGTITLADDTFTGNSARGGSGGISGSDSGVGAGAAGEGLGGAVFTRNGSIDATFVTFSGNTAAEGGTDLYVLSDVSSGGDGTSPPRPTGGSATAQLVNCILGQNATTTVPDFFAWADTIGGFTATAPSFTGSSNNLVTLNGNGAGSNGLPAGALVSGTDPNLAAAGLSNNGGDTKTIALTAASTAALGTGATGTGITVDQRDDARATPPDLGAFQLVASVTNVSSTAANGTYGPGALVPITVAFSDPVTVTGTPQLTLTDGALVNYTSGSGTSTLTFDYTVAAGQTTGGSNLDDASTTALALNGGTITAVGLNADLTLPSSGAAGSLSANRSIVIDAVAPTVTAVTSTTANGSYGIGSVITITVGWSKAVVVTGTPELALNSGGTASYSSGSGTSTLTFAYTVAAGQNSPELDYTSTSALSLNGGTIFDTVTDNPNAANLTLPGPGLASSIEGTKSIAIDTTAPTVTQYDVIFGIDNLTYNLIGSTRYDLPWQITGIKIVFSEPVTTANVNSLTGLSPTGFSGLGTNTLVWSISTITQGTFSTSVLNSGMGAIKDAAGNILASPFSQNFKVLYGDFNGDGVVSSADMLGVYYAVSQPYNIFADLNGDGVVNTTDVQIARNRIGAQL